MTNQLNRFPDGNLYSYTIPPNTNPRDENAHPSSQEFALFDPPPTAPFFFSGPVYIPALFKEIAANNRRPTIYANELEQFQRALNHYPLLRDYAKDLLERNNILERVQINPSNKVRVAVNLVDQYAQDAHEQIAMLLLIFKECNIVPTENEWRAFYFFHESRPNYILNVRRNARVYHVAEGVTAVLIPNL